MNNYLLIDFGASKVKTALVDLDTGDFFALRCYQPVSNCSKAAGEFEVPLELIKKQFLAIIDEYTKDKIKGIMICSQMHGFAFLDSSNNPVTNYISWKDERSLKKINGIETFLFLKDILENEFKDITGMKLRPGLPFANSIHLAKSLQLFPKYKMVTIPEWITVCGGDSANNVHETMLAGLGFYDLKNKVISSRLAKIFKEQTGAEINFNNLVKEIVPGGYININSKKIPVYTGVGDHQCAILGACNIPEETISINLGTGSQVSIIGQSLKNKIIESRPYFNGDILSTVTHIPAGRAINEYMNFLIDICKNLAKVEIDFEYILQRIEINDIMNSSLYIDLALFKSAVNYSNGGKIENIMEGKLTSKNYISSIIMSFIKQYIDIIDVIDPRQKIKKYIFSGGISKKIPLIPEIFQNIKKCEVLSATKIDETFLGLRALALMIENKSIKNFKEAQNIFGRNVVLKNS